MVVEEKLEDVKESLHRRQVAVFKRIRPIAHIFENSEESANCECDDEIYQREAEPKRFAFEMQNLSECTRTPAPAKNQEP